LLCSKDVKILIVENMNTSCQNSEYYKITKKQIKVPADNLEKINMTPEEIVNQYYWWVLSRIKTELLTSPTGKPIRYELSHVGAAGVPNNQTEENILRKLNEWSAIKIVNEITKSEFHVS